MWHEFVIYVQLFLLKMDCWESSLRAFWNHKNMAFAFALCEKQRQRDFMKWKSSKTSLAEYKYTLNSIVDAVNEWAEERAREREWESER